MSKRSMSVPFRSHRCRWREGVRNRVLHTADSDENCGSEQKRDCDQHLQENLRNDLDKYGRKPLTFDCSSIIAMAETLR